jgi:uncharacterized protein
MTFTPPVITAGYAALVGLLAALLTVRVIIHRGRFKVDTGDGGQAELAQSIRAHGNLTEHAPIALLLIGFAEMLQAPTLAIIALGGVMLLARLASAWGLSHSLHMESKARQSGAGLTVLVVVLTSLLVLYRLVAAR